MRFRLFGKSSWDIQAAEPPWRTAGSIHDYIGAQVRSGKIRLTEDDQLPDEVRIRGDSKLGWIAGGLDGAFGHHGGSQDSDTAVSELRRALRELTSEATSENAAKLYSLLVNARALEIADSLLEAIRQDRKLQPERIHAVARWLAAGAPDREPVKIGIALLGITADESDRDLLMTLGRHEEFTLFVAVALRNSSPEPETLLWELVQHVTGWGRIQIVERLGSAKDPRLKAWLLREGYKNDVMYEYTALTCAVTGELLAALRADHADAALLAGAGEILDALIRGRGGPAAGIEGYPDGAAAAELYVQHVQRTDPGLRQLNIVSGIENFLNEGDGAAVDPELGWPRRKECILAGIAEIRRRPGWKDKITEGLASEDRRSFWEADEAAKVFGIDTWEVHFERLERGEDQWFQVMETEDAGRVDRVVRLAEERLPLHEIASGPAEELGLGPGFRIHSALDFVLQGLRRFPGRGWPLIRAGLQSPVVRNRNMALHALAAWPQDQWPDEARLLLKRALRDEPNASTAESMRKVLAAGLT
jgi:hypothetical protein